MENLDKSLEGQYEVTLDEAGRIAFPRDLRKVLEEGRVVVTKGADPCLWVFTAEDWRRRREALLKSADPDTAEGRDIRRRNIANPVELDRQGRILIPPTLRDHANLNKDCLVFGLIDYVEIWDKESYKAYECSQEKYHERSEAFAQKKEIKSAGNNAYSGIASGNDNVSGSEGGA